MVILRSFNATDIIYVHFTFKEQCTFSDFGIGIQYKMYIKSKNIFNIPALIHVFCFVNTMGSI